MTRPAAPSLTADCRGVAAIEFALVAPVFLAMLLGIAEFAYQTWTRVALDYALAQAARCYVLGYVDSGAGTDCASVGGAAAYLQTLAAGVTVPAGALTVTSPSTGCLKYTYAATWLVPGIMPVAAPTFTGTSCFYY